MIEYDIPAVPFEHAKLDEWRDPFAGIAVVHQPTGLTVCGGVDDIWLHNNGELIIVDYKSTSKDGRIEALSDSPWDQQYKRQLGVYRWLLEQQGFKVQTTGYLVYANASKSEPNFDNKLVFETTLVPVTTDTAWIESTLEAAKDCLAADHLPPVGDRCEFCPYREASGKKLQQIHKRLQSKTE